MKTNPLRLRFITRILEGLTLGLSFLFIISITYAFSAWNSGLAPQASPANGNVQLSSGAIAGGLYGICSTSGSSGPENNSSCQIIGGVISCGGRYGCDCPSGYTLVALSSSSSYSAPITETEQIHYWGYIYTCVKN